MRLQEIEKTAHTSGFAESQKFDADINGHSIRILSDLIYSDVPLAIVRELGSNAWDSHVEAGTTDTPIEIQLPNPLLPVFSIRDYGTGMSHNFVMSHYSVYFRSTKQESNDYTGALGLGAKVPMAYTDNFTLKTWQDGEERLYIISFNSEGIPTVNLLEGWPQSSDQPDGVEISFSINEKDHAEFINKARQVFYWYDTKPTFKGVSNLEMRTLGEAKKSLDEKGWSLIEREAEMPINSTSPLFIRQGTVVYPVELRKLARGKAGYYGNREYLKGVFGTTAIHKMSFLTESYGKAKQYLLIDMPIGSVQFTASREELQYDTTTCENIIAKIQEVDEKALGLAQDKINSYSDYWEAVRAIAKLFSTLPKGIEFDGKPLDQEFSSDKRLANGAVERVIGVRHGEAVRNPSLAVLDVESQSLSKWTERIIRILDKGGKKTPAGYRIVDYVADSLATLPNEPVPSGGVFVLVAKEGEVNTLKEVYNLTDDHVFTGQDVIDNTSVKKRTGHSSKAAVQSAPKTEDYYEVAENFFHMVVTDEWKISNSLRKQSKDPGFDFVKFRKEPIHYIVADGRSKCFDGNRHHDMGYAWNLQRALSHFVPKIKNELPVIFVPGMTRVGELKKFFPNAKEMSSKYFFALEKTHEKELVEHKVIAEIWGGNRYRSDDPFVFAIRNPEIVKHSKFWTNIVKSYDEDVKEAKEAASAASQIAIGIRSTYIETRKTEMFERHKALFQKKFPVFDLLDIPTEYDKTERHVKGIQKILKNMEGVRL